MSKIKFVVVSKDENFKMPIEQFEQFEDDCLQISDNKQSISKVYNDHLHEFRSSPEQIDYIVFMHADVELDVQHLVKHIEECKDKYDVFGLCGTSTMNVSQSPLNWWTGSAPTPTSRWGCVIHGELGNQKSFFSSHSQNITDHEVACIDGLCIIFGPKAIASNLKFDEQFVFDFYDTDVSFQAILNYNLKLGVLVEQSLQHYSVGKSILTNDFLMHELDFRRKWHLEIPNNSKLMDLSIKLRKNTLNTNSILV